MSCQPRDRQAVQPNPQGALNFAWQKLNPPRLSLPSWQTKPLRPSKNPAPSWLFNRFTLVWLTSLLLCVVIYWLRFNTVFGHPYVDDAYYLLLGKALANGQPYALINTPVSGIMPIYPPLYP